jgi:hypothetical protein
LSSKSKFVTDANNLVKPDVKEFFVLVKAVVVQVISFLA